MLSKNTFSTMVQQVETMIPMVEEFELPHLLANLKRCHMQLSALSRTAVHEKTAVVEAAHQVRVTLEGYNNAEGEVAQDKERLAQIWVGLQLLSAKAFAI